MNPASTGRRSASSLLVLAAALSCSAAHGDAHAATILVGGDACDFTSIQDALDAAASNPGADTIRVATNATYTAQALKIANQSLTITGGFSSCTATEPTPGARTIISGLGGAADSVVEVLTSGPGELRFENLLIRDGDEGGDRGGGGIDFQSRGNLTLANVIVAGNRSGFGGGIYFEGSGGPSTLTLGPDTVIQNNIAERSGGGVRISGDARLVMAEARSTVTGNEALGLASGTGFGGGVQIVSPAQAEIGSPGLGNFGAISTNRARFGGGLAMSPPEDSDETAWRAILYSTDPQRPARIDHNVATVAGGGVYLLPDVAEYPIFCAFEFRIDHNLAPDGAAIFMADEVEDFIVDASFASARLNAPQVGFCLEPLPPARRCAPGIACNSVDANRVVQANGQAADGAIIALGTGAELNADRVALVGNHGSDVIRTRTTDRAGQVLSSLLIAENVLTARVMASDAVWTLRNVTIAGNAQAFSDVLRMTNDITLRDSVIWQPGKQSLGAPHGTVEGTNVLTNDPASLPIPGAFNLDPRFVDSGRGDYRLRAASPGIDASMPAPSPFDLDGQSRNRDLPIPDGLGPLDLGAYERQVVDPLLINGDFFADLAQWTVVAPGVSNFDSGENVSVQPGSGSMSFDYIQQPVIAARVESRAQCVHLPLAGSYLLTGFARTTGSGPFGGQRAVLHWELRHDGGESCADGPPDAQGDLRITSGPDWQGVAAPARISVATGSFTRNSSIRVSTVMESTGATPVRLTGWFDEIRLRLDTIELFADGFE